jgi:hypothetical protein
MSTNEFRGGSLSRCESEADDCASEEDDADVSVGWEGFWSVVEDDKEEFEGAWPDGEDAIREGGFVGRLFLMIYYNSRCNEGCREVYIMDARRFLPSS